MKYDSSPGYDSLWGVGPFVQRSGGPLCTSRLVRFRCMVRLGTCAQAALAVLKVTEGVKYSKFNHRVQVVIDLFKLLHEDRSTTELHEVVHTLAERAFDSLRRVSPDGHSSNWLPGSLSEFKSSQQSSVGNRYQVKAFNYANRTKDICNGHQDGIR
jgi:hypothetical protein